MNFRGWGATLLVVFLWPSAALAQSELIRRNVQFEQLATMDGLPHPMVYAVEQDADGFIWIATQEVLGRFDGHEVTTFSHLRTDASTLTNDFVRSLFRDSRDRLWIGTEAGVDLWLGAADGFDRAPLEALPGSDALSSSVRAMAEEADGTLWFATAGSGLIQVDESQDVINDLPAVSRTS